METILFLKELKIKGDVYFDLWISILMQLDGSENQIITPKQPLNLPKTNYYRVLQFGLDELSKLPVNFSVKKERGRLVFSKLTADVKNQIKPSLVSEEKKIVELKINKHKPKSPALFKDETHDEIIKYLNEQSGKDFKSNNKSTASLIELRRKEGYSVDDFKKVIFVKCKNWIGSDMEKYIRPITLFSHKFDSYLNESVIVEKNKQQKAYDTVNQATELGWNQSS